MIPKPCKYCGHMTTAATHEDCPDNPKHKGKTLYMVTHHGAGGSGTYICMAWAHSMEEAKEILKKHHFYFNSMTRWAVLAENVTSKKNFMTVLDYDNPAYDG